MATSVVLSEICVAAFLWRLHACVDVQSICYVDDISVIASTKEKISRAFDLLVQFTHDLSIGLACTKTKFWGTFTTQLKFLAEDKGVNATDTLDALGLQ